MLGISSWHLQLRAEIILSNFDSESGQLIHRRSEMSYYMSVYHEVYLPPMLPYSRKVSRDETFASGSISQIPEFQPFLLRQG